jgi:hypothetical protein
MKGTEIVDCVAKSVLARTLTSVCKSMRKMGGDGHKDPPKGKVRKVPRPEGKGTGRALWLYGLRFYWNPNDTGSGPNFCGSVDECEDDGAVFLHAQDGRERVNMFLDDDGISWRRVWKCGDCSKHGYKMLSCDHFKVLRPRGVLEATGGTGGRR